MGMFEHVALQQISTNELCVRDIHPLKHMLSNVSHYICVLWREPTDENAALGQIKKQIYFLFLSFFIYCLLEI